MRNGDVFVIRHGESEANVQGCLTAAPPGPGLTDMGWRQAEVVARWLLARPESPSAVAVSPFTRTRETALPLVRAAHVDAVELSGLSEVRVGAWEGQRISGLERLPSFSRWRKDPECFPPPGGERISEVVDRAMFAIDSLRDRRGSGPIVAYAHRLVIAGLYLRCRGLPWGDYMTVGVPNCAVLQLRYDEHRWQVIDLYHLRLPYALRLPRGKVAQAHG